MKREIYLDNSATTPLCDVAKEKITEAMDIYANPSSLHAAGQRAHALVEDARASLLCALGVRPRQGSFVFTSSGTEASALAIFGVAYAKTRRDARRILTTDSEHPSVSRALERLEKDGFEVVRIPTRGGALDTDAVAAALDQKILLATFMLVNNETGAIYDVKRAFSLVKAKYPDAVTHCDAVQGFLKIPFTPTSLGADLVTVSAHKIHAPKGIGGLYIANDLIKAKKITPFLVGGGQENGMRSGTENTLFIAAFGAVASDRRARLSEITDKLSSLRAYAEQKIGELDVRVNRPQGEYAPYILNITLPNIKSETMLHHLSGEGIYVSSGSACSSHASHPSESLLAFGLPREEADCSIRISFSEYNTQADVDALCEGLRSGLARLVRIKR